ncbi:MAG: DinB family protein [Acidobacteriaceae bacterium]|jgi:hypothetical protein
MPYTQPVDLDSLSPHQLASDLRAALSRAESQLSAISPEAASQPLAPGKWSIQQTIGHLIDSCNNNLQRLVRLQLAPQLIFPGYQQDDWVRLQRYDLIPWPEVLALFLALNRHFAHAIEHADARCFPHTWLYEGDPLTLGFILADYIAHLDHHLRQLPD